MKKRDTIDKNLINIISSATLNGVQAKEISVEATFTKGLPSFSVVGLAGSDIQEAKERVKAVLLTNGFTFPPLKITINLAPSDARKSGTHFDLPIALLIALHKDLIDKRDLFVFGELGLDGKIKSSSQIFPILLSLKEQNLIKRAMVPKEAIDSLRHIPEIEYITVEHLQDAIEALKGKQNSIKSQKSNFEGEIIEIAGSKYFYQKSYPEDFNEVKGQELAKRASLIASAGMHNFLMEGSPGCGKSMIAKRLRYILPPLQQTDILSIAKHQFLDNQIPNFKPIRPFRSPHHTATSASIFGGGSYRARIGEVALANQGILFFDELPHFSKNILEALREPLQDREVNIARVNSKVRYEANFMFVSAMNPCPCGNLLSQKIECRCSEAEIKRYRNRLSDPFLDRIDIFVTMQEIKSDDRATLNSSKMHQQIIEAFKRQKERGQTSLNGKLTEKEVDIFCKLDLEAQDTLSQAIQRFGLSHRSIVSIKKVARTIADLEGEQNIKRKALLEALSYRRRR